MPRLSLDRGSRHFPWKPSLRIHSALSSGVYNKLRQDAVLVLNCQEYLKPSPSMCLTEPLLDDTEILYSSNLLKI